MYTQEDKYQSTSTNKIHSTNKKLFVVFQHFPKKQMKNVIQILFILVYQKFTADKIYCSKYLLRCFSTSKNLSPLYWRSNNFYVQHSLQKLQQFLKKYDALYAQKVFHDDIIKNAVTIFQKSFSKFATGCLIVIY